MLSDSSLKIRSTVCKFAVYGFDLNHQRTGLALDQGPVPSPDPNHSSFPLLFGVVCLSWPGLHSWLALQLIQDALAVTATGCREVGKRQVGGRGV